MKQMKAQVTFQLYTSIPVAPLKNKTKKKHEPSCLHQGKNALM